MFLLNVRRALSTAYHPQTDGLTERINSILEQYLRAYVNFDQDNWVDLLPLAEFAYNNSYQTSAKQTPFRIVYGTDPRVLAMNQERRPEIDSDAKARARRLEQIRKDAYIALRKSQEYQSRYYNQRKVAKTFKPGQYVHLDLRNITTIRESKKLDAKASEALKILERVGPQAYRIELPAGARMHDIFHISLLREHHTMEGVNSSARFPLRIADQEDKKYIVNKLVDSRVSRDGNLKYRVKWTGYPELT